MNRRDFLIRSAGAVAGLSVLGLANSHAIGQDDETPRGIDARTQRAIDDGLRWLSRQQHADGAFGTGIRSGNVAVTSLAAIAFMAGGHQPGRGEYGDAVNRALRQVLSCERRDMPGLLERNDRERPMYGHGYGTLFLAEAYGMVNDPVLRESLRGTLSRAVRLIVDTQNSEGGWRYQAAPTGADLSVTVCQIMALRAARNAGIYVPRTTADRCTAYAQRCQHTASGGFRYQPFGNEPGFARTGAGIVALNSAGIYDGLAIESALTYLDSFRPGRGPNSIRSNDFTYFYGHYYAAQAMWTAGGARWRNWYPAVRRELLSNRRDDNSWSDGRTCSHYCTAMALIALQVPNNYLPILQR
jgi:hypothetical protein